MANRRASNPTRIPVGGNRDIMTVHGKDDSYHYRWVNDVDNRLEQLKAAGYEPVTHEVHVGTKGVGQSTNVGDTVTKGVGQGVTAYLMRIPKEWHEEDKKAKAEEVNRSEELLNDNINDISGRYGEVKIKRS